MKNFVYIIILKVLPVIFPYFFLLTTKIAAQIWIVIDA